MPVFYSPSGNAEMWDEQPEGYITREDWPNTTASRPAPAACGRRATSALPKPII